MKHPTVSILIVTFNSAPILGRCLDSIAAETTTRYEIILVDNASTDGTPVLVGQRYPTVRVIKNASNRGFSVAVNQAAAQARGQYLLLLNPDTMILEGAIDRLAAYLHEHPAIGICAPVTLDTDGTRNQNSQPFYTPGSLFWTEMRKGPLRPLASSILNRLARPQSTSPSGGAQAEAVYGCALMIPAELYAGLGGLDERFFMYEEDLDLCWRVQQAGYAISIVSQVTVIHVGGASGGASAPGDTIDRAYARTLVTTRRTRSRFLYAAKHFDVWFVVLMRLAYIVFGIACYLGSLIPGDPWRNTRRRLLGRTYLQTALWQTALWQTTLSRRDPATAANDAAHNDQHENRQGKGV